jgi:hypothetical protein
LTFDETVLSNILRSRFVASLTPYHQVAQIVTLRHYIILVGKVVGQSLCIESPVKSFPRRVIIVLEINIVNMKQFEPRQTRQSLTVNWWGEVQRVALQLVHVGT